MLEWHLIPLVCLHVWVECLTGGRCPAWLPLVSLLAAVATEEGGECHAPSTRSLSRSGWARVIVLGGMLGASPPWEALYLGAQAAAARCVWPPHPLEAAGCAIAHQFSLHPAVPPLAARLWPLALLACSDRGRNQRQVRALSLLSLVAKGVPRWLVAELTHRCPLSCFYCSNPLRMSAKNELRTEEWKRAFREARDLGAVQLGFTGGEPLMRADLPALVREASGLGYYTNLITSAVGLTEAKLEELKNAGLDSVQISFQAEKRDLNDYIGGKGSYEHKRRMMRAVKEAGLPLTLNVVIHRLNIDRMEQICRFCESMDPDHVELASTQYHGWAFANRKAIMPTPDQVARAQRAIREYQETSSSGIYYVLPDLLNKRAKRCHQGWGSTYVCINPQGDITPCLSAHTLPSLEGRIPNVRTSSIEKAWEGPVFKAYGGGVDWMSDPHAREHPRRDEDQGGCRCQAYLLTGDECAMDPADETSEHHEAYWARVEEDYSSTGVDPIPRRIRALKKK